MGAVETDDGQEIMVDGTLEGNPSLLFDAVIVPEGEDSLEVLLNDGNAKYHLMQAYKHLEAIGLPGRSAEMLEAAGLPEDDDDEALVCEKDTDKTVKRLIEAMRNHRAWDREEKTAEIAA